MNLHTNIYEKYKEIAKNIYDAIVEILVKDKIIPWYKIIDYIVSSLKVSRSQAYFILGTLTGLGVIEIGRVTSRRHKIVRLVADGKKIRELREKFADITYIIFI